MFVNFFFPLTCSLCGRFGRPVCQDCEAKLPRAKQICPVCRRANPLGVTCPACQRRFRPDGLLGLYRYDALAKRLVHSLKFEDEQILADFMASGLARMVGSRGGFVVTFVPVYPLRRIYRGYNQSELLARRLASRLRLPCLDLLRSTSRTPQTSFDDYRQRAANLKGKLLARARSVPKKILVVDDIFTSGATLREASKVLKRGGAQSVVGVAAALAV